MLPLIITSFLAGALTILSPCVLPLLPIILAGSVGEKRRWYPWVIIASLVISIVIFTAILKASTLFIDVPPSFWKYFSGGILVLLGIAYIWPRAWTNVAARLSLQSSSTLLQGSQNTERPFLRAILTGAALGPVFSSCSPTYTLILATIFPASFAMGMFYTGIYALGLSLVMVAVALGGRLVVSRLNWLAKENGWFKKTLGVIFVVIGLSIITGIDKKIEEKILTIIPIAQIEESLLAPINNSNVVTPVDNSTAPSSEMVKESSAENTDAMVKETPVATTDAMVKESSVKSQADSINTNPSETVAVPTTNKTETLTQTTKLSGYMEYSPEKLNQALLDGQTAVLFFHAPWCPSCRSLNERIAEGVVDIPKSTVIFKVDYDSEVQLKKKYGVTYQHTNVILDKNANALSKKLGAKSLEEVLAP